MGEHTDKIEGKAKQVAADLIDDDELHAEGEADVAAGKAIGVVDNIAGRFQVGIDWVGSKLRQSTTYPCTTLSPYIPGQT